MSKKQKIDINGSVKDAAGEITGDIFGMMIVTGIIGFLVAPMFTEWFRESLREKYNVVEDQRRQYLVERDLKKINGILWAVSIISWIVILTGYCARRAN